MTKEDIEILKKYSENEQMQIVNKSYTKEEVAKMSKAKLNEIQRIKIIHNTRELEKEKERLIKESRKTGVFGFNDSGAKQMFWGVFGLIAVMVLFADRETILESPEGLGGLPIWGLMLIVLIGVWVLAKQMDKMD